MGNIGFDINGEFLPSFDKFQSEANQRLMFLKFFNQEVCCDMKFSKEELKSCKKFTLFEIFTNKILKNLCFDSYIPSRIVKLDIEKTNTINSFLNGLDSSKKINRFYIKSGLEESDSNLAKKLIDVLKEADYSFYLDGEKIFRNYVQNKIIRNNVSKEILINKDSIDIKTDTEFSDTKIFTFWKLLDSKNPRVDEHIKKAVECIETSEFKQVYLVYPKNEKFNRHIQIKCDEITCSDYEIKLIPYSLRSHLR